MNMSTMRRALVVAVAVLLGLVNWGLAPQSEADGTVTVTAATAGTKKVGEQTFIWGTAAGAPNRPVSVQVIVNGKWSTSQKGTTSSTGYYALPLTYGATTPGTYTYRAAVQTSTGAYAYSPNVTLTRVSDAVVNVTVTAATAGTKTVREATNIWGTASGAPGRPVSVQVLLGSGWSTSQKGTTNSSGFYALPLTYGATTPGTYTYRAAVYTSSGTYVYSPSVTLTRTPVVTVTAATAGTKPVGEATNIWGTATGAPNTPVSVQVIVNGKWSTSQKGTTNSSGFYALPLTYGATTPGTYTYRAVVHTLWGTNVPSGSVTLTRTSLQSVNVTAFTAGSKPVGTATNIWGTATGAPNRPVSVQVLLGTGWSTSQKGTTNSSGFYALPLTYGATTPGTYTYRAAVQTGSGSYVYSPNVTLTRTAVNQEAVAAARDYLSVFNFSRQGLIDQLVFDNFTTADATGAVDSLGVNWSLQAKEHAITYLEYDAFSYTGLIAQLEYERYTSAQAKYGADNSGGDWFAEAVEAAQQYDASFNFTRDQMIAQLVHDGFTAAQAEHGANAVGL